MPRRRCKLPIRRGHEAQIEDEIESSGDSSVDEDDCPVIVEDSRGYREEEECLAVIPVEEKDLVDVEICNNLEDHFGDDACEDSNGNRTDGSGDDMWNDDTIPDPLTDDDEEEAETTMHYGDHSHELLRLYKNAAKIFFLPGDFRLRIQQPKNLDFQPKQ